ncbi:MAG: FliH/SctL family protein [Acetatifactor sp.]
MSNIVKQYFTVVRSEDKRIIDTNDLAMKRIGEQLTESDAGDDGFISGLKAEELVPMDEDICEEESEGGNAAPTAANTGYLVEQARKEAITILEEARAEAARITEEARSLMEAEKNKVLTEAGENGYREGLIKAGEEAEALRREYREKEAELESYYRQQIEEMEPKLVDAITDIYQHIFDVELSNHKEILLNLLRSALKGAGGRDFLIHVSREDYIYISENRTKLLEVLPSRCELDVVEDQSLAVNECLIETEGGMIDCGLDTQMTELKQKLRLLARTKEE